MSKITNYLSIHLNQIPNVNINFCNRRLQPINRLNNSYSYSYYNQFNVFPVTKINEKYFFPVLSTLNFGSLAIAVEHKRNFKCIRTPKVSHIFYVLSQLLLLVIKITIIRRKSHFFSFYFFRFKVITEWGICVGARIAYRSRFYLFEMDRTYISYICISTLTFITKWNVLFSILFRDTSTYYTHNVLSLLYFENHLVRSELNFNFSMNRELSLDIGSIAVFLPCFLLSTHFCVLKIENQLN